jgi:hypothetical protein
VKVYVEAQPVRDEMIGDYFNDPAFRETFQEWVNQLWIKKDETIRKMLDPDSQPDPEHPLTSSGPAPPETRSLSI